MNGLKLEQYIVDLKNKCPDTKVRVVAHSLGAAIVDRALVILGKNPKWNDSKIYISTPAWCRN